MTDISNRQNVTLRILLTLKRFDNFDNITLKIRYNYGADNHIMLIQPSVLIFVHKA